MPNDSWMMQCALILCKKTVATASTAPLRTVSLLAEQPLTESKFSSVGMNLVNSAVLWPNCVTNFQIIFTFCRNFRVFFQIEMKYSEELAQELFRIERNAKKSIIFFSSCRHLTPHGRYSKKTTVIRVVINEYDATNCAECWNIIIKKAAVAAVAAVVAADAIPTRKYDGFRMVPNANGKLSNGFVIVRKCGEGRKKRINKIFTYVMCAAFESVGRALTHALEINTICVVAHVSDNGKKISTKKKIL